jgi:hypothetical protein
MQTRFATPQLSQQIRKGFKILAITRVVLPCLIMKPDKNSFVHSSKRVKTSQIIAITATFPNFYIGWIGCLIIQTKYLHVGLLHARVSTQRQPHTHIHSYYQQTTVVSLCSSNWVPQRGVRGSERQKCIMAKEFYWQSKICMYECK